MNANIYHTVAETISDPDVLRRYLKQAAEDLDHLTDEIRELRQLQPEATPKQCRRCGPWKEVEYDQEGHCTEVACRRCGRRIGYYELQRMRKGTGLMSFLD